MMTHDDAFGLIMDALDGVLSPADDEVLQQHLAVCSECYAEWQALRLVDGLLTSAPTMAAPAGFSLRVRAQLEAAPWRRTLGALFALSAGSLVALALVAIPAALILMGCWTAYRNPAGFTAWLVWLNQLLAVSGSVLGGLWTTARLFVGEVSTSPVALGWAVAAALAVALWARFWRQPTLASLTNGQS